MNSKDRNIYLLKVVHLFLLTYLSLHNLIIPLLNNLIKGHFWLGQIHPWPFYQYFLFYQLNFRRSPSPISDSLWIQFGLFGSLFRLVFELGPYFLSSQRPTFSVLSVLIEEGCSLLFYFFLLTQFSSLFKEDSPKRLPQSFLLVGLAFMIQGGLFFWKPWEDRPHNPTPLPNLPGVVKQGLKMPWQLENLQEAVLHLSAKTLPFRKIYQMDGKETLSLINLSNQRFSLQLFGLGKKDSHLALARPLKRIILSPQDQVDIDFQAFPSYSLFYLNSNLQKNFGSLFIFPVHSGPSGPSGPSKLKEDQDFYTHFIGEISMEEKFLRFFPSPRQDQ